MNGSKRHFFVKKKLGYRIDQYRGRTDWVSKWSDVETTGYHCGKFQIDLIPMETLGGVANGRTDYRVYKVIRAFRGIKRMQLRLSICSVTPCIYDCCRVVQ